MRNDNQHVSGTKSPTAVCGLEPMEARTLLSANGFHGGHPLHVVAPFDAAATPTSEHNFRVQSFSANEKTNVAHVSALHVSELAVTGDAVVIIAEEPGNLLSDRPHAGGYGHGDAEKTPRAIPSDDYQNEYPQEGRGEWRFPGWTGFIVRAQRNDAKGQEEAPVREPATSTGGRQVLSVDPTVAPAQSGAIAQVAPPIRVAATPVAKAIFSTEPVRTQVMQASAPTIRSAAALPGVAAPSTNDLNGRSVILYLSLLSGTAQPAWLEAKAAAVQVVTETAVAASPDGLAAAMAAAVYAMPSPQQAADIVRLGSPFMLIADSIGTFIEESARIPALGTHTNRTHRAWTVTAAVIAADLMLLAYCYRNRRERVAPV